MYARDAIYDPRFSEISRGTMYCEVPGVSPDNTFPREDVIRHRGLR